MNRVVSSFSRFPSCAFLGFSPRITVSASLPSSSEFASAFSSFSLAFTFAFFVFNFSSFGLSLGFLFVWRALPPSNSCFPNACSALENFDLPSSAGTFLLLLLDANSPLSSSSPFFAFFASASSRSSVFFSPSAFLVTVFPSFSLVLVLILAVFSA